MTAILVVEDEQGIRETVAYRLRREGWEVDEADDARRAVEAVRDREYDVVVLDLILPDGSGLDVCRSLRAQSDVPIVILTARDDDADRIVGLELGADDYVTKPFSLAELVSRVRAILRRRQLDRDHLRVVKQVGGLVIDVERHQVTVDGVQRQLTPAEFRMLSLMASTPGRVFTRRELSAAIWGMDSVTVDNRACDVHVANLRRKLERVPHAPRRLITVRGVGYRLDTV